jgi:hypothetical protein
LLPSGLWKTWLLEVRPSLGYGRQPLHLFSPACPSNQSLNALVSRFFLEPACAPIDAPLPIAGRVLAYALAIAVLVLSLYAVRRAHLGAALPSIEAADLGFCLFLATMFLVGSLSWEHHLVFAMPGLVHLLLSALRQPRGAGELLGLAACLPGILVALPLNHPSLHHGWAQALVSIRTYAVILLWSMLWLRLRRSRTEKTRENLLCTNHVYDM